MAEQVEYVVVGLGAFGSATAYQLARRGAQVVGLEQFTLGHERGASHDTSRILRHSYHTPGYVRLTFDAYNDWAALSADAGEQFVTTVGGLDLFPPGAAIPIDDYIGSMTACEVRFDALDADEVAKRWPQFQLPEGTLALHQPRGAIVPAARGTAAMQRLAHRYGARLRDRTPVTRIRDLGSAGVEVVTDATTYRCRRLILCADAWTNQLLDGVGVRLPLTVTAEQVTYFAPPRPEDFTPGRMPLWIWMDNPSFYGFPCYGEPTVKAAQDCGGRVVDVSAESVGAPSGGPTSLARPSLGGQAHPRAATESPDAATESGPLFDPDPQRLALLTDFMAQRLPGAGQPVRSKTCLYTLTPDRDFVLDAVPGHESVLVALGVGHGFKFSPTIGRLLADLAVKGETAADLAPFRFDRPALADADSPEHWLV